VVSPGKVPDPKKRIARLFKDAIANPNKLERSDLADLSNKKTPVVLLPLCLRRLAVYAGHRCLASAHAGDEAAARLHLDESFRLRLWANSPSEDANTTAATLAEASCRGQGVVRMRADVAQKLSESKPPKLFLFAKWVLALCEWQGALGGDLVDNPFAVPPETGESAPGAVVDAMCAWHLKEGTSEKDYAPYLFGAFPLLPVEVMLWRKRRLELGRTVADSDHPLLHTPVARLPLSPVDPLPVSHPLLGLVAERLLGEGLASREWLAEVTEEHRRAEPTA